MRCNVCRQVIGIDLDDNAPSLAHHRFPGPGGIELDGYAEKRLRLFQHFGVRVIGRYRFDSLAIRREQDHRAEVSGRTRDVLCDDGEQRFHVRNRIAEGIRRGRDCSQANGIVARNRILRSMLAG